MSPRILIVDDEENMRHMLSVLLSEHGYHCELAQDGAEAIEKIRENNFDFVLSDIRMPRMDGPELLREIKNLEYGPPVIMMSAYGTIDTAIETMKQGAYDYITKPFRTDEILLTIKKAEEREGLVKENLRLKSALHGESATSGIITNNKRMKGVIEVIQKVSVYKSTVLITGESGTGKELVARAIHDLSPRASKPFIPVNCGAIPENLLETELFGHVKGAFTDASHTKTGLFEEADGGTILLDEIGELPLSLQVKLLRVLEEEAVRKVGATENVRIDVRVIAATLKDLAEEVKRKKFRADLYYRLNVLTVHVPPLRERKDDIPLLVDFFVKRMNERLGKNVKGFSRKAMADFMTKEWEGNVRELENSVERAMAMADGDMIGEELLPPDADHEMDQSMFCISDDDLSIKNMTRNVEEMMIRRALVKTGGNRTKAAKLLQISHRTLLYKIKEYGVKVETGHEKDE